MADETRRCHPHGVAPREVELRADRSRPLPADVRAELERLAAALDAVGPPPPVQLYRAAKHSEELMGPLLHVGVELDMLRFQHEQALEHAAMAAVRDGYSPAEVAEVTGFDLAWLVSLSVTPPR